MTISLALTLALAFRVCNDINLYTYTIQGSWYNFWWGSEVQCHCHSHTDHVSSLFLNIQEINLRPKTSSHVIVYNIEDFEPEQGNLRFAPIKIFLLIYIIILNMHREIEREREREIRLVVSNSGGLIRRVHAVLFSSSLILSWRISFGAKKTPHILKRYPRFYFTSKIFYIGLYSVL